MRVIDLTGRRFGRLVVRERSGSVRGSGNAAWRCHCDCGREKRVNSRDLLAGHVASCGCYSVELLVARSRTHGMRGSRTYASWVSMRQRCGNPGSPSYADYGGRGIKVCDRWQSFERFYADMGERPEGCSLDRIDVDGDYEPGNCRWADATTQVRNTRATRRITHDGATRPLAEWAERTGLPYGVLYDRLRHGWSVAATLTTPLHAEKSARLRAGDR